MPQGPPRPRGSSPWALGRTLSPKETWPKKTPPWGAGPPTQPSVSVSQRTLIPVVSELEAGILKAPRTLHFIQLRSGECRAWVRPPRAGTHHSAPRKNDKPVQVRADGQHRWGPWPHRAQMPWGAPHTGEGSTICGGEHMCGAEGALG